jgi:hypothetical protein
MYSKISILSKLKELLAQNLLQAMERALEEEEEEHSI